MLHILVYSCLYLILIFEKFFTRLSFQMQIIDVTDRPGRSLSKESFTEAGIRLADLNRKDAERKRTSELKNTLEEYVYSTKEKVCFGGCGI